MQPISDEALAALEQSNPDLVAQYRAKMAAGNQGVQDAQDVQNYGSAANLFGKAATDYAGGTPGVTLHNNFQNLGKAPATIDGARPQYDGSALDAATARGVSQAKDQRDRGEQQFMNEQKVADEAQKQRGYGIENARNDPNGPQAQSARLLLRNALAAKAKEADAGGATDEAAQLREMARTAGDGLGANDIMAQHSLIKDTSYDKVLEMKVKQSQIDANSAVRADANSARVQRDEAAADAKKSDAYSHARKDLEQFRGNAAAQQASRDVLSAEKALQMVKGKDPNTLTTQDLHLLSSEISKIATGGVPTEHGQQALMPNNLQTKAAEMQNFLLSQPTDAQSAAYVQKNMKYLEDMQGVAKRSLNDYRLNVAKGYKGKLRDEDYNEMINDYGLGAPPPPAQAATPLPAVTAPAGKPGWAK